MAAEAEEEIPNPVPSALACLAIIGRHLGVEIDAAALLRDRPARSEALGTAALVKVARRAGLQSKVLHLGFDDLAGAEPLLPGIARFRDGSSMVLLSVRRDSDNPVVVLQDPNADTDTPLVLDRPRFEGAWTGDLVVLRRRRKGAAEHGFGWSLVRRVIGRERSLLRDLVLSTLALAFVATIPVLYVQLLVQRVYTYGVESTLAVLSLAFLVAIGAETALGALRRFIVGQLTARVEAKLSTDLLERLLALPLVTAQRLSRGSITFKVDQLARLRAPATADLLASVLDLGLLVFFLPLMAFLNPVLTGVALAAALAVAWWAGRSLPRLAEAVAVADGAAERRAAFQSEVVTGIQTVKSLALDESQRRHWLRLSDELADRRLDVARRSARIQALATPAERLLVTGTLALGVYLAAQAGQVAPIGPLVAFYLLVQRLAAPLLGFGRLVEHAAGLRAAVAALGALVNPAREEARAGGGSSAPLRGHITFQNVGFRYDGALSPALRGVSFDCPAGTLLGIMGRSGSGKSTVTRLLQRQHGEHRGAITLDAVDIRDFDLAHLSRSIGIVGQDSFVFGGTIRENITAAKISATFEEVTAAARLSGADEFIDTLPRGYETLLQEGAPTLSSGQRQRLALARAFITNPRILVLDEALSALDGDIEMRVLANLRKMAGERTIILVSHRLTALMAVDAVMVMEDGTVHDFGRHHDLLERSDLYSHQWHRERVPPESDPQTDRLLALS